MPIVQGAQPGTEDAASWGPYKLWCGDLWKCHGCDHEIIVGVGQCPVSEHYLPDFESIKKQCGANYQVNDC